jgi:hypothetical protein
MKQSLIKMVAMKRKIDIITRKTKKYSRISIEMNQTTKEIV